MKIPITPMHLFIKFKKVLSQESPKFFSFKKWGHCYITAAVNHCHQDFDFHLPPQSFHFSSSNWEIMVMVTFCLPYSKYGRTLSLPSISGRRQLLLVSGVPFLTWTTISPSWGTDASILSMFTISFISAISTWDSILFRRTSPPVHADRGFHHGHPSLVCLQLHAEN